MRIQACCVVAVAMLCAAHAAASGPERPHAVNVGFQRIWRGEKLPIELPVLDEVTTAKFSLPAIPARPGTRVCLRFRFRLHAPANGGWGPYLGLDVNGRQVGATGPDKASRLLNRRPYFRSSFGSGGHPFFGNRAGRPAIVAFFAPDFDSVDNRVTTERNEAFWFLIDVGDLVRPDGGNTLEFHNMALKQYWGGKPPDGCRMIVDDLEVGYVSHKEASALRSASLTKRTFVPGISVSSGKASVTVPPGGGIQLEVGGEVYFMESEFSYPDAGYNRLVCDARPKAGQPGWTPVVRKLDDRTLKVRANGPHYRLARTVRFEDHRIVVEDAVSSATAEDLGVRVRHRVIVPDVLKGYRLGGVERGFLGERSSAPNPTVFVRQKTTGVGITPEDNVFRLQVGAEVELNEAEFHVNHLGLRGKADYTLRWAIYPVGTDYFDFVNALRRDWKANFTVLGPFEFLDARKYQKPEDAVALRTMLRRKKLSIFCLGPWFEYYDGYGISRDEYKALMRNASRR